VVTRVQGRPLRAGASSGRPPGSSQGRAAATRTGPAQLQGGLAWARRRSHALKHIHHPLTPAGMFRGLTRRMNGALGISRSPVFWYFLISYRAQHAQSGAQTHNFSMGR
jgi:hypothetical protein